MPIIFALCFALFLGACAAPGKPYAPTLQASALPAGAYCTAMGYHSGSYEYDTCYRNRPDTRAYARNARLQSMQIITANRSPRTVAGLSLPVE